MYNTNAHNAYIQSHLGVESPEKLVQMLYEGILRFNTLAKRAIENREIEKKTYWLNRTSRIFGELIAGIDFSQGDVAHYLHGLYAYQLQQLTLATCEKLDNVNHVIKGLSEAWKESTHVA